MSSINIKPKPDKRITAKDKRKEFEREIGTLTEQAGISAASVRGKSHSTEVSITYGLKTKEGEIVPEGAVLAEKALDNFPLPFTEEADRNREKYKAFLIDRGVPEELLSSRGPKKHNILVKLRKLSKIDILNKIKEHDSPEGLAIRIIDCIDEMFHQNTNQTEKLNAAFLYGHFLTLFNVYQRNSGSQKENAEKDRTADLNNIYRKLITMKKANDYIPKELWFKFMGLLQESKEIEDFKDHTSNSHNNKTWKVSFFHEEAGKLTEKEVSFTAFTKRLIELENKDSENNS